MIEQLFGFRGVANAVGGIYIFIGITGTLCNMVTLLMITCYRIYRLSAYTIMANLALADAVMLIIAGLVCGLNIVQVPFHNYESAANNSVELLNSRKSILNPKFIKIFDHNHTNSIVDFALLKMDKVQNQSYNVNKNQIDTLLDDLHFSLFLLSFLEIAAWTAGIISYALLGINRCVAICFYRTRAKTMNRVSFALIGSTITWLVGIITAYFGTMPVPLIGMRTDMWTVSFLNTDGRRPAAFIVLASFFNFTSLLAQWSCSLMVLMKIHKVRHKINCNKLNIGSAKRFKKQARLTFQFFYPSLICTISSIIFFAKPFMTDILTSWQYILLHLVWLCNHMCNPFIYAYFNERMRLTYGQWITCAPLRRCVHKLEKQYSRKHGQPLRISKRLNAATPMARNSYWRSRSNLSENFVRSSLQMQSRDFEQFCEVMMSVNTANESSEGWTESSSDTEAGPINTTIDAAQRTSLRLLDLSDKESDNSKEGRWRRRQFSIGKQECFICEKLIGSDDNEIVRCPSTSDQINDSDERAVTVDESPAFGHNKIRKCSFPSCTLRFHENCFLIFTEGDFLPRIHILDRHGDLCINLKDSKKWLCPQHECNFCHQELLRTRAFQGKFIRCVKCVFAWHRSCVIVGSLHIDRKRDRYVLCPRHSTVKRVSKRNISYCIKCENSFENESQKVACDSCIRSFCHSCVDKNKIEEAETDSNSFVCDFCRCFDFPRIGDYVLATYKSRFWPARALHADLLPLSLYSVNNLIEKLREPGYVLVEWIEGLSVPNYDVVTCRDLVSFPKTLRCSFWNRMKIHANIYKATESIYASSKAAFGIQRPLPREVKAEILPKYTRIKTNINMRLARARSNIAEFGHCNCEPINGKRCTTVHNCLNRILMSECPEDCDATYFERRSALAGGTKRQVLKRTAGLPGNKNFSASSQHMCTNNFLRYHDTNDDKLFMEEKPTKLKGFGAFAKCDIDKGTDLTEYIGQVTTKEEYLEKLRFRSLFNDLEASYFGMRLTNDFYVDARNYGSVARSFNHSCEPNTKVDAVTVDGIYRLKISTIKNIRKGEELTFDYDTEITEGLVGMECFCGSTSCRRIIGKKANTARKIGNMKACSVLNEQANYNNGEDNQSRTTRSKNFSWIYENSIHSGRKHRQRKRRKYVEGNKSSKKDFFGRTTQNEEYTEYEAEKHLGLKKDFLASRVTNISVKNTRCRSREQSIVLEHEFLKDYAAKQLKKGRDYQFISDEEFMLADTAQIAKDNEMERT